MDQLPAPLVPAEVDSRSAAAARGLPRYFDGNPCVHGHVGDRYTRNAYCVECQRLQNKDQRRRIRALMDGAAA